MDKFYEILNKSFSRAVIILIAMGILFNIDLVLLIMASEDTFTRFIEYYYGIKIQEVKETCNSINAFAGFYCIKEPWEKILYNFLYRPIVPFLLTLVFIKWIIPFMGKMNVIIGNTDKKSQWEIEQNTQQKEIDALKQQLSERDKEIEFLKTPLWSYYHAVIDIPEEGINTVISQQNTELSTSPDPEVKLNSSALSSLISWKPYDRITNLGLPTNHLHGLGGIAKRIPDELLTTNRLHGLAKRLDIIESNNRPFAETLERLRGITINKSKPD